MTSSPGEEPGNYTLLYRDLPQLPAESQEVRLVWLNPGAFDDCIVCSLVKGDLDSSDYDALSYTWEESGYSGPLGAEWESESEWEDVDDSDELKAREVVFNSDHQAASTLGDAPTSGSNASGKQSNEKHITINGITVGVKSNLEIALRHLRYESKTRTLWIDYLCINQGNVADRNAQVRRMDMIYRKASHVIIWLGLPSEDSGRGLEEIYALTANIHLSQLYSAEHSESRLLDRIKPVVHLLSRSWFQRVWVVQEVALAKQAIVQIGSRTAPWDWFVKAARVVQEHMFCCADIIHPFMDDRGGDYFLNYRDCWASILALGIGTRDNQTLHMALRLFYNKQGTDPRDKVYGLLGLLNPSERLVVPDYDLSSSEVYEETASKIMDLSKDLSILMDIDELAGDVDAPSWCPDWTTNSVGGLELYDFYNAAGDSTASAQRCSARTLKLQAIIFDTVTCVDSDPYDDTIDSELWQAYLRLRSWENLAKIPSDGDSPYPAGGSRNVAFWQTVLMGLKADRTRKLQLSDLDHYKTWRAWLERYAQKGLKHRKAFLKTGSRNPNIRKHNQMLKQYPATRYFFLTEDGYMGLGPDQIEQDDVVCVLAGAKTPFILRAIDQRCEVCQIDQCCYRLKGFAYVHGIMNGETVAGIERQEEEWSELCLR
ncbi:hypothetical protein MMC17_006314 [Xylographa soralifera]|nr:hypothetical protein [Xylographa soralifera]